MESDQSSNANASEARSFGRYNILEPLATGGMAQIFKAKTANGRIFTLKKILKDYSENQEFIRMFLEEAKISLSLKHANIIRVLDFGQMEGTYYLAMEYVFGRDLAGVLKHCAENRIYIPIEVACHIILQCCRGLAYAHGQTDSFGSSVGIVHRDISPPNILVSYNGESKILDFGIAKAVRSVGRQNTRSGVLKGKFSYMSPEQASGIPLNSQSDIFSLGIVFHELLTSRSLFYSDDEIETLERVRKAIVKAPSKTRKEIPDDLDQIVMKALSLKLKNRYQSCAQMAEDIRNFLRTEYPRSDARDVAKFLRSSFKEDFSSKNKGAESEGWKDILEVGGADEDLLLDQSYSGGHEHTSSIRAHRYEIPWYQRLLYDPKHWDRLRRRILIGACVIGGLALTAFILFTPFPKLWFNQGMQWAIHLTQDRTPNVQNKAQSTEPNATAENPVGAFKQYVMQGQEEEGKKHFSKALENYEKALQINSFEQDILVRKNFMLLALGRTEEACPWFERKSGLTDEDKMIAEAACEEFDGETQKALVAYGNFLKRFPDDPRSSPVQEIVQALQKRLPR